MSEKDREAAKEQRFDVCHYQFAHKSLPQLLFFRNPVLVFEGLTSPVGLVVLKRLWASVSRTVAEAGHTSNSSSDGIEIRPVRIGKCAALLITMPPARFHSAAKFVALVRLEENDKEVPDAGYALFTLERQTLGERPDYWMVGRWLPNGAHCTYDECPGEEATSFLSYLSGLVENDQLDTWSSSYIPAKSD